MSRFIMKAVAAASFALIALCTSTAANALAIYTYQGNPLAWSADGAGLDSGLSAGATINGFFVLNEKLAPNLTVAQITPITYAFFDSLFLHTPATDDATVSFFWLSTNSAGALVDWEIQLFDINLTTNLPAPTAVQHILVIGGPGYNNPAEEIDYRVCRDNQPPFDGFCDSIDAPDRDSLRGNVPGTWRTFSVPEPSTIVLFGLGLAGLAASRRRKL